MRVGSANVYLPSSPHASALRLKARTRNTQVVHTKSHTMSNNHQAVSKKGARRPFPQDRQTVLDIVRQSQLIPSFPLVRRMKLGDVVQARGLSSLKVGWTTLFGKAYAIVCQNHSELREMFVSYPYKHLYCHPHSVASISIHRADMDGRHRLIFGRWINPESASLVDLQNQLDFFCTAPMALAYREGTILENRSVLVRRFVWWWVMNCSGRKRAKHIGTFSISSLGGQGSLNAHHPLITTTSLAFGPIAENGQCEVVLICDHRTLDGMLGAKALEVLESVLCNQVVEELVNTRSLCKVA